MPLVGRIDNSRSRSGDVVDAEVRPAAEVARAVPPAFPAEGGDVDPWPRRPAQAPPRV